MIRVFFFSFFLSSGIHQSLQDNEFPGFNLLYTSNPSKFFSKSVHFEKSLPAELKDLIFVQNGPAVFEIGRRKFRYIIDGLSKPVSFYFKNNNHMLFTFDILKSNECKRSSAIDDIAPFIMCGPVDPPFGFFEILRATQNGMDNNNINIVSVGKGSKISFLATNDYLRYWKIDPLNLTTFGVDNPSVPGAKIQQLAKLSSAHPLPEPGTSNLLTFVTTTMPFESMQYSGRLRVLRLKSSNDTELVTEWKIKRTPYMHSFALSAQYMVITGAPLFVDTVKMLLTAQAVTTLIWKPKEYANLYVVNFKNPSEKYKMSYFDGLYHLHHINAYERQLNNGHKSIVFYSTVYNSTDAFRIFDLNLLQNVSRIDKLDVHSRLHRYEVFLSNGSVLSQYLPPKSGLLALDQLEFPVINNEYRYKKNCFVYGVSLKADGKNFQNQTLVKRSFCDNYDDAIWMAHGHYPAEPQFIPRANAKSEDDGYLISLILDGVVGKSYVGIWDAKTMELINRAYLPTFIPYRTHGNIFKC